MLRKSVWHWVLCLVALTAVAGKSLKVAERDLSQYDFRDGDIVFQHLPSKLGSVICEVTDSPLSHCGMIVHRGGEPWVLEAVGPVRYIRLAKWLKQGDRGRFAQMRVKEASGEQIAAAIREAELLLGRPYDIQYELDEEKIYCSELVYKAYERGAGIEVGSREILGDLNWRSQEAFIRAIAGGELPLKRVMVTPASIARDPGIKLLHTSFPPRRDEPLYNQDILRGTWQGDYTIRGLAPATTTVEFGEQARFVDGTLELVDGTTVEIEHVDIKPFAKARRFSASLRDARGLTGELQAQIHDQGRRIVGTWKDDEGYRGVFSLERRADENDR